MILSKNKKNKYYVIFVKKEHGIFKRLRKKRISAMTNKVRYKKHTYFLNMAFPTYSRGVKIFYFVDVSKGQLTAEKTEFKNKQILFKGNSKDEIMSPKLLDKLVSQSIVSQLTANLSDNAIKMNIMTMIIGIVIGTMAGFILAGYV